MSEKPNTFDEYLGDGVCASYDGYHIILDLRGQDNTTRIALEPSVLNALNEYVQALLAEMAKQERSGE